MSDAPLVRNPSDEEQIAKAEESEKLRERIRAQAWRAVLNTADGRQVIQEILQQCGTWSSPGDFNNVNRTFARIGQQSLGLWLVTQIDVFHADALWQMKREETKRMEV